MAEHHETAPRRDLSLDWLKGALVAVMVCHHGIEYFDRIDSSLLRYLDFVTGSFVFVALFISGQTTRRAGGEDVSRASRAIWRSLKLIALFSVLNIVINSVLNHNYNGAEFGINRFRRELGSIYLGGNKRAASFEILLPIAYAQLIASYSSLVKPGRILVPALLVLGFVSCLWSPRPLLNVYYGTIGLFAYEIGLWFDVGLWRSAYASLRGWLLALAAAVVYLLVAEQKQDNILTYSIMVTATCFVLLTAALYATRRGRNPQWMPLVGRYSLFCYLFHIAVLQAVVRTNGLQRHGSVTGVVVGGVMFAVVVVTVLTLDRVRNRLHIVNGMYRAVFA